MDFQLTDGDERSFHVLFQPPFSWSHVRGDEEMRYWRVLSEEPGLIRLMHGTGAVALLTRTGDRVTAVELIQGPPAEPILRQFGFQATPVLVQRVRDAFAAGRPLSEAARAFGSSAVVIRSASDRVSYRTAEGPVIDVELDDDRVRAATLRTGGDALDQIRSAAEERRWSAPRFPGNPLAVRNAHEAALFLDVMQGTRLDSRVVGPEFQVLAQLPEGRMILSFRPAAPAPPDPADFGEGRSVVLDPGELVLYADRVQREAPGPQTGIDQVRRHARRLRMAAGALRQAARFTGLAAAPPPEAFQTPASRSFAAAQPERFRTSGLLQESRRLDQLATEWESR